MDIQQEISRFRMQLLLKMPFYGDVMVHLPFIARNDISTAATDGKTVWYNPDFLRSLTPGDRNFVLMHEVFHILLRHSSRGTCANRNRDIWNVACDIIVNSMLKGMISSMNEKGIPFSAPTNGIYADVYSSETAENLYGAILEDQKKQKPKPGHVRIRSVYRSYHYQMNRERELPIPRDIVESQLTPEEMVRNDQEITEIIKNALEGARSAYGSYFIPPELHTLNQSKPLNWKKLLRQFLSQEISDETSYATPERKYLHMDLILPGHSMSEGKLEEVWAFVDSSGSIGKAEMQDFLTQLYHITKEFRCNINICYWDTAVTDVYRNIRREKDILNCLPQHSGGTDINCVYSWLRKNRVKPTVMLVLTDGYFGMITTPDYDPRLRRRTILVLDSSIPTGQELQKIGKIARLKEEKSL